MKFASTKPLTLLTKSLNLNTWLKLVNHVKHLPYGRNANRNDFSLVLKEQKGSCSSKHALLKSIALENNFNNIKLILGVFKMNSKNTPKISSILEKHNIEFIPEAHCYLKIDNYYLDITNSTSDYNNFKEAIIEEQEILPQQVIDYKVNYHKEFLKNWLIENNSNYSFKEFCAIRESCILKLSR
ncbi:hypothetical protein [Aurantibacter sp.]|uniref:hypothetical protein n=1 Tax=Aurantibacter sp. TaxID=2807103 RepID=UPI0035C80697